MSKKNKRRATIQPMRSVRSIREIGLSPDADADYEINDGEEFQARDGSNVKTMAEAEADERRELRLAEPPVEAAEDTPEDHRTIPQLVWSLATSSARLVANLAKLPFASRAASSEGQPS